MRHQAIYNLYPDVVSVSDVYGAFNEANEIVVVDEQAIQIEVARLIALEPTRIAIEKSRAAYREEADPLFFKAQRGEATMEDWQAKVAEIKARFPKE